MISKMKKRKIFIPKGLQLRKCSVHLGQIDNLITRLHSKQRKSYGGKQLRIGTPAPPGTKLIRVKSDLFRKTSTPLANSERVSKRTPKPNRRYVNDETVNSSTWNEKEVSSEPSDDDGDDADGDEDRLRKSPQTEPTRKNRNRIAVPKSVGSAMNKESDKLALTKRKIQYDERPGPKQHKKVSVECTSLCTVELFTQNAPLCSLTVREFRLCLQYFSCYIEIRKSFFVCSVFLNFHCVNRVKQVGVYSTKLISKMKFCRFRRIRFLPPPFNRCN